MQGKARSQLFPPKLIGTGAGEGWTLATQGAGTGGEDGSGVGGAAFNPLTLWGQLMHQFKKAIKSQFKMT